jgi:hypothetical protein
MTARERLPNRRPSEQIAFACNGFWCVATVSRFSDGRLAEIFISNGKCGSDSDVAAHDSAVVCSIALQYGVPPDAIQHALMRDTQGRPNGPLGTALAILAAEQ